MKAGIKLITIGVLVGLLALVRLYEYRFFYDPFMYFFEVRYEAGEGIDFPAYMFVNVLLRFLLNTLISLLILYVAFRNTGILKFSALIYSGFFIVLFPLFIYLMHHVQPNDYLAAFYVRRFLAHPVLILLLLPAFYYYRLQKGDIKD
ncbi:exosortase F system-associated membrane protein [Salinimicrobium oceani]|uniref:Exosortase F system-associated protein n=1 Tax=Salinimicrobium oceani TaxID=2722702 RepID=A0ABX1CY04_9FLAO|nr:exosortase F system-associated protein [Salinimicrobium oceani]NJW53151.1 exosortase F system-associated protein [Salinimicrobium oceani]